MKDLILKYYDVTICGQVFRKKDKSKVVFSKDNKGYLKARVYIPELSKHEDKRKPLRQHRIVAACFLENYSEQLQVNHKNGVKHDNRVCNLEMVTAKENTRHGWSLEHREKRIELLKKRRDYKGRFGKKKGNKRFDDFISQTTIFDML
jgi:hypothetical protein